MISPTRVRVAILRRVGRLYRHAARFQAARSLRSLPNGASVQLGSGGNQFAGWVNVDISRVTNPDIVLDLRGGFPAPVASVRRIYSEHVLEHLELEDAIRVLQDLRQALVQGGVLRIAMPDLDSVIDRYKGDWKDQPWLADPAYAHVDSAAHMLNFGLRAWGHKYLYSYAELELRLRQAGFSSIERVNWGTSVDPELRGRETRPDSLLVVEAR